MYVCTVQYGVPAGPRCPPTVTTPPPQHPPPRLHAAKPRRCRFLNISFHPHGTGSAASLHHCSTIALPRGARRDLHVRTPVIPRHGARCPARRLVMRLGTRLVMRLVISAGGSRRVRLCYFGPRPHIPHIARSGRGTAPDINPGVRSSPGILLLTGDVVSKMDRHQSGKPAVPSSKYHISHVLIAEVSAMFLYPYIMIISCSSHGRSRSPLSY